MNKGIRKNRKTRRRFTEEQKSIAVQQALELMNSENRSLFSTAKELGICQSSLRRWLDRHAVQDRGRFVPVEMAITNLERPLVKTPQDVRVEGLTVEGVARLLRLLAE